MTTLTTKLLAVALAVLLLVGLWGYVHHTGVIAERDRVAKASAKEYQELTVKYDTINKEYTTLRAKKSAKRQEAVAREDKIIHENPSYYSGDCFDATGLQHIQESQASAAK